MLHRKVVEPRLPDDSEFFYAAQPELLRYKASRLAVEGVMAWYQTRAEEIEHHARQVTGGRQLPLSGASSATWGPWGSARVAAASSGGLLVPVVGEGRMTTFVYLAFASQVFVVLNFIIEHLQEKQVEIFL